MPLPIKPLSEFPMPRSKAAGALNDIVSGLTDLQRAVSDRYKVSGATARRFSFITEEFFAKITSTPPSNIKLDLSASYFDDVGNFTTATYWVKRLSVSPKQANGDSADRTPDSVGISPPIFIDLPTANTCLFNTYCAATNRLELPPGYLMDGQVSNTGCHLLQDDTVVFVYGAPDPNVNGGMWYFFEEKPFLEFVITGNGTRPGVYTGQHIDPTSDLFITTGSSAVDESDIGTAGTDVVLVNRYEMNKSPADPTQHDLSTGQIFEGKYVGQDNSDPSKYVFLIEGINFGNCS